MSYQDERSAKDPRQSNPLTPPAGVAETLDLAEALLDIHAGATPGALSTHSRRRLRQIAGEALDTAAKRLDGSRHRPGFQRLENARQKLEDQNPPIPKPEWKLNPNPRPAPELAVQRLQKAVRRDPDRFCNLTEALNEHAARQTETSAQDTVAALIDCPHETLLDLSTALEAAMQRQEEK